VHTPLRSRCVPFALRTVPAAEIGAWLTAMGVEPERAEALARDASGFPADALRAAGVEGEAADGQEPEEARVLSGTVRARLHAALRAGAIGGREARAVLALWALAEEGLRRASPPRLVADVLHVAMDRLERASA
jgi:hypothetical protein